MSTRHWFDHAAVIDGGPTTAAVPLLYFSHAGTGASSFAQWIFPARITAHPVQLPRGEDATISIHDQNDPIVDPDEITAWSRHTSAAFSPHSFTGGHYFHQNHRTAITSIIGASL